LSRAYLRQSGQGLLVLARTGRAAATLGRQFRSRAVEKTYVAVVAGRPEPLAGTIRYGLVKAGGQGEAERMRPVHPDEVAATPGALWRLRMNQLSRFFAEAGGFTPETSFGTLLGLAVEFCGW
jgi:16S rRNA U516 pseudouridylate synthase RsuA-like enzyme